MKHRCQYILLIVCISLLTLMSACIQESSYDDPVASPQYMDSLSGAQALMQKYLHFSRQDLDKIEKGQVLIKVRESKNVEHEIEVFGAMQVNAPRARFLDQVHDIESFIENDAIQHIKKFSEPPRLADLQELTLDDRDLKALKACRPEACKLKLDVGMMKRFQEEMEWTAADSGRQATQLMRQSLLDALRAYQQEGNSALGEYPGRDQPLRLAEEFDSIMQHAPLLVEYVPELYAYLQEFPQVPLPQGDSFFYWTKEKVRVLKPIMNLFHATIYTRSTSSSSEAFLITKRIYSSHYFESSLGMTLFIETTEHDGSPASYLVYLNRSRFDNLRGPLKTILISLMKRSVHRAVETSFYQTRQRLEAAHMVSERHRHEEE